MCGTPVSLLAHNQRQKATADDMTQRWVKSIGLAAAIGLAYFVAAKFSVRLIIEPAGVAVFWPAAGISSGLLVALGPRAGWAGVARGEGAALPRHPPPSQPPRGGAARRLCRRKDY